MGVDIEIAIVLGRDPGVPFINRMNNLLRECSPIEGTLEKENETNDFPEIIKPSAPAGVTYRMSSATRYYGEGYERGPFLSLYGLICYFRAAFRDYEPTIYYGGDYGRLIGECGNRELNALMDHFVAVGESPYRDSNYDQ